MLGCCCTTVLSTIRSNELLCIHRILLLIDPRDYPSAYVCRQQSGKSTGIAIKLGNEIQFRNHCGLSDYRALLHSFSAATNHFFVPATQRTHSSYATLHPECLPVRLWPVHERFVTATAQNTDTQCAQGVNQQTNEPESGDPRASNEPTMGRPGQRRRVWVHCASINERLLCGRALTPEMDNKPATASFGGGGTGLDWMYRMWMHVGYAELRLIIE